MNELYARIDAQLGELEKHPGWCLPDKAKWLARHIVEERLSHVVEIGVFGGRSLIPMGWAVRHLGRGGYALGLDPYLYAKQVEALPLPEHNDWWTRVPLEDVYRGALRWIVDEGLTAHCGILRAASDDVASLIGPIDLLHIDGCHSALAACRDVETYVPKVRPGGLVIFDDMKWGTLQPALRMMEPLCEPPRFPVSEHWAVYRRL